MVSSPWNSQQYSDSLLALMASWRPLGDQVSSGVCGSEKTRSGVPLAAVSSTQTSCWPACRSTGRRGS